MAVNHFRVGEAPFGKDLLTGDTIEGMHNDVLNYMLKSLKLPKTHTPTGELGENVAGNSFSMNDKTDLGVTPLRAILDIGLLTCTQYLSPDDARY
jgi:hypothetical protein